MYYLTLLPLLLLCSTTFGQLSVKFEPEVANLLVGQEQTFNMVVESGFDNLIGLEFTIVFDHLALDFVDAWVLLDTTPGGPFQGMELNYNPPPGPPNIGPGIKLIWVEAGLNPRSLTPGTAILAVRLRAKTPGSSQLRVFCAAGLNYPCEVINGDGVDVGLNSTPATINISGSFSGPTLIIGHETGPSGATVCVPVTVNNFTDIQTMDLGITWQTSILTFSHLQNCNPTLGLNCTGPFPNSNFGVNNNILNVSWFDPSNGVNLPNGSVLFEICYNVQGNMGQSNTVNWINNPPQAKIELRNSNGVIQQVNTQNGSVTIGNTKNLTLRLANKNVCESDTFCIPIHTKDFKDIIGLQTFVTADPTKAKIIGVSNCNPKLEFPACALGTLNFQLSNDTLTMLWIDPDPLFQGKTLDSNEVMLNVCFENLMQVGDSVEIKFTNKQHTPSEAEDKDGPIGLILTNGKAKTILCDCNLNVSAALTTNVTCPGGNNGAINLIVTGGSGNFSYQWSPALANTNNPTGLAAGIYRVTITDMDIPNCQWTSGNINVNQPPPFNITATVDDESCIGMLDGSISLAITGGTMPYTVNWGAFQGNPITNLAGGNYTPTITDANNCVFVGQTLNVGSSNIQPAPVVTPVSCFGANNGSIALNLNPGAGPYTVTWTPSSAGTGQTITNLPPGMYTPSIVSASGCEIMLEPFIIAQPEQIVISESITHVVCHGAATGSIVLNVTGGAGNYSFTWSGGVNGKDRFNITAGTYPVTVTDGNGCTRTASYTVTNQNPAIAITATTTNATAGQSNGTITLTVTGGASPYTYLWSNGEISKDIMNIPGGQYSVTVTDALGCTRTQTITISMADDNLITFQKSQFLGFNVSCHLACDGSLIAFPPGSAVPPVNYKWSNNAGGGTNAGVVNLCVGMYSVTITDATGKVFTGSATITEPPAWTITVQSAGEPPFASAFVNISGPLQQPYEFLWSTGDEEEILSNLIAGRYCVSVTNVRGCAKTACVEIFDMECLKAREVITPNGDNRNDEFVITCIQDERYMNNRLEIYNRWGQRVYTTTNYQNDWMGFTQGGTPLPEDVYFYVLEYTTPFGEVEVVKGTFNILR